MTLSLFVVLFAALFAGATLVKFRIGERRFLRRSIAGMQLYSSYGQAVATSFVERNLRRLATLVQFVAGFLLVWALAMLFVRLH